MNAPPTTDLERWFHTYLATQEDDSAEIVLGELVTSFIEPVAVRYLRRRTHSTRNLQDSVQDQDMLDIAGDVRLAMIRALRRYRASRSSGNVESLNAYTLTVTRNAYHSHLRRKYPNRLRLRNQLRYVIAKSKDLRLEKKEDVGWICGTSASFRAGPSGSPLLISLNGTGTEIMRRVLTRIRGASSMELGQLVPAMLGEIGKPALFEELVSIIAEIRGVCDRAPVEFDEELDRRSHNTPHQEAERREKLSAVWRAIIELPLRHRTALLLHLADVPDENLLMMFTLSGVASIRSIAEAIEIEPDEFAQLWNRLPLPDNEIAERMGLRRQQVINLRQSARFSLRRRLKNKGFFR